MESKANDRELGVGKPGSESREAVPNSEGLAFRARQGIKLLLGRQVAIQILTFAGGVVLARSLMPAEFGLFGIATFLVGALAMVGDFGLAPSLIQRSENLAERDLQVAFTVQQVLLTAVVVVLWLTAPNLVGFYPEAPPETVWLIRALAFGLYLSSWRSMSALQLERRLEYKGLALIEVVESLSYQVVAVGMAVLGFGVWSLVAAVLTRGVLGTAMIYHAAPWKVRFAFDRRLALEIVRYGVPFQAQGIVHKLQSWVTPTVVAGLIGPQAVGFLMWASPNGKKPLLLLDSAARVAFPHIARQQGDRQEIERTLIQYLNVLLIPCALWASLIAVAGHEVVEIIYTDRWTPAVGALTVYAFMSIPIAMEWMTVTALNGTGQVSRTTLVVAIRSVLTVVLGTALVTQVGFVGVPIAEVIVLLMMLIPLAKGLGTGAGFRLVKAQAWIFVPFVASISVGYTLSQLPIEGGLRVLLLLAASGAVFSLVTWVAAPVWFRQRALEVLRPLAKHTRFVPSPAAP